MVSTDQCVAHDHLQAAPQYPQQHQLPFNLGSALPHQGYGAQHQALHNLGHPGRGLPSLGNPAASHIPLGSPAYGDHHQQATGNQTFGNPDLATQLHFQRLQNQQHSYAQPQQRSIDINKLFAPRPYGNAPAANMSALPVSPHAQPGCACIKCHVPSCALPL